MNPRHVLEKRAAAKATTLFRLRYDYSAMVSTPGIGCNRGPVGVVTFKEEGTDQYRAIDVNTLDAETQEKVSWGNLWPQSLPKFVPIASKPALYSSHTASSLTSCSPEMNLA